MILLRAASPPFGNRIVESFPHEERCIVVGFVTEHPSLRETKCDATQPSRNLRLRVIDNPQLLLQEATAWCDLATDASEPNSFYEPWFLNAAWDHLADGEKWQIIVIDEPPPKSEDGLSRWVGFFPFLVGNRFLKLWQHNQCFLTTPLIRRGREHDVLSHLMQELRARRDLPGVMEWPLTRAHGPIELALIDVCRHQQLSRFTRDLYCRAMLHGRQQRGLQRDANLLQGQVTGHHWRELKRQRRRLSENSSLEFRLLRFKHQAQLWTDWFLELEASGWKGKSGTALNSTLRTEQFFRQLVADGLAANRLEMAGLFRDGEPIAMKVNFLTHPGSFAFKIAYSDALARWSPGVQLEIDYAQYFEESGHEWMDSCAVAGHTMIDRLWPDRQPVHSQLISTGHPLTELWMSSLPLCQTAYRLLKRWGSYFWGKHESRPANR